MASPLDQEGGLGIGIGAGNGISKRPSQLPSVAVEKGSSAQSRADDVPFARKRGVVSPVVCLVALPLLMTMVIVFSRRGDVWVWTDAGQDSDQDRFLGSQLVLEFDQLSCVSRFQAAPYRRKKDLVRSPSAHLVRRLREQEALQRGCAPGTDAYQRAEDLLDQSGQNGTAARTSDAAACKYLVLVPYRGLGNRILAMASAFLYAMLTDRVLLVDRGTGTSLTDLFCEPFSGMSWLLPRDFPIRDLENMTGEVPESYRNLVQNSERDGGASVSKLPYVFVDLDHACTYHDKLFYCDDDRQFLHRAPWLVMRTDGYFTPALFLNPVYQEELDKLFPRKDSVFYLLAQYLFHPTNKVWGLITRFHTSYLRNADEQLGIQIRVFDGDIPFKHVLDQILACTSQEHLLPEIALTPQEPPALPVPAATRTKAVLMTGLSSWYYENIRGRYWQSATTTGEVVSVHQPSHEEHQLSGEGTHDMKALAEMYLLSMSDAIVTSGWSTFGYIGHGLGGLTPSIMFKPENHTTPSPPCRRAMSMEPCMHGPPFYGCREKRGADTGKLVPHVRHCEDMSWGLKLVHPE